MPFAAVFFSLTSHPGIITGPGVPHVRIAGWPAAVLGDQHVCAWPTPPGHPSNVIDTASMRVRIGGRFAARVGDKCACGAIIATGIPTVNIG